MRKMMLPLVIAAAVGGASSSAMAEFLDFEVTETSVPGAVANVFTADKLNGGYTEFLGPTGPGTFSAAAIGNLGQFFKNEGTVLVPSQLNGFGASGYSMYAVFTATGNIVGPNLFSGTTGSFYLYLDPNSDTTTGDFLAAGSHVGLPAVDALGSADDYLLASTTTSVFGTGNLNGPPGAFDITFKDFVLTAAGSAYFTAPVPFHMVVNINGDYDGFVTDPATGIARVTGDVSAVFKVPEPGGLALVGVALAGLGLTQRKRKLTA